ncbi:MAG: YfiR family protein [Candidatus Acidiferrales bacterium]
MQSFRSISQFALLGVMAFALAGDVPPAPAPIPVNYRTEAADLQHFAEFVEWPTAPNQAASRTINFCVLGQDPFGAALDQSILGHPIDNRAAAIVRGKRLQDLGECDVLFVSSSEASHQAEILGRVRESGVLTVGETTDFAATGGVIQFVQAGPRVSFEINVDAAGRAGLKIRAELLALAHVVHDNPGKSGK